VAVRTATPRNDGVLSLPPHAPAVLAPLIRAAATTPAALDGYGRAAVDLEVHGCEGLTVQESANLIGVVRQHALCIGGDLAIPASDEDIDELAQRWVRELARAAGMPLWEPGPQAPGEPEASPEGDDP